MRPVTKNVCCALAGLALVGAAGVLGGKLGTAPRRAAPPPELTVSGLDFGETWEDTAFPWTLEVQNSGPNDIRIANFSHSCSCATIEPHSLVIPAGASRELNLKIDLTDDGKGPARPTRPFRVQLWPNLDPPGAVRYEWNVTGVVRTPVQFGQRWVDVGQQSECEQPIPAKRVTVKALLPLGQLVASCTAPEFRAVAKHRSGDPSTFDIEVAPSGTLPPGPIKFDLVVTPELPDGKRLSPKRLPVAGYVQQDLQASPPESLLGARLSGQTIEETVTLRSLTGRKFTVKAVKVDGEGSSARAIKSETGEPTFQIRQRIAKEGQQTTRVVFVVRLTDGVECEVAVSVSYLGLPETKSSQSGL